MCIARWMAASHVGSVAVSLFVLTGLCNKAAEASAQQERCCEVSGAGRGRQLRGVAQQFGQAAAAGRGQQRAAGQETEIPRCQSEQ